MSADIRDTSSLILSISDTEQAHVADEFTLNLSDPQPAPTHYLAPPLSAPPQHPVQHYRDALRYHADESQRSIKQQTIDQLAEANLSRNVKETLTSRNRFQRDRSFWDRNEADVKGQLQLNAPTTSMQQRILHRQRGGLLATFRSAEQRFHELSGTPEYRRIDPQGKIAESSSTELSNVQENLKRTLRNLLIVVDFQVETLESFKTQSTATEVDLAKLNELKSLRQSLRSNATQFNQSNATQFNQLSSDQQDNRETQRQLQSLAVEVDHLEAVWSSSSPGLDALGTEQESSVARPSSADRQVQSRIARSSRLRQIGSVLVAAQDDDIETVANLDSWRNQLSKLKQSNPVKDTDTQRNELVLKYSRILHLANTNGLDLKHLPKYASENYYIEGLTHLKPHEQERVFSEIDSLVDGWAAEYRSLAESLVPKGRVKRTWEAFKNWFSTSVFRRKTAETGAFGTEGMIAQNEAGIAIGSLKAQESGEEVDTSATEKMDVAEFVAKDVLHTLAIVKNADDFVRIQKEVEHKKHKIRVAEQGLRDLRVSQDSLNQVDKYRSNLKRLYFEKLGDQEIALDRIEQGVAVTQVNRHAATMGHDIAVQVGLTGVGTTIAKVFGAFGAAAAEFTEGVIGSFKAIRGQMTYRRLDKTVKRLERQLETETAPQLVESLKYQIRTLNDLKDQQTRLLNVCSSLKGFGMAAGYTLVALAAVGVTTVFSPVVAPILLASFATVAVGIAIFKVAKATHEIWKIQRTEDLLLGRGGDTKFLADLIVEAEEKGTTPEAIALTRISRGHGAAAKRPTAMQLLHQLKWQTRDMRFNNDAARELQSVNDDIQACELQLRDPHIPIEAERYLESELQKLSSRRNLIQDAHFNSILRTPAAHVLRNAYRMSQEEIVALVDAPNSEEYDEIGAKLIGEYQAELTQ
ncbi:hypothetical protein AB1L42_01510 [Thalassoglobus sp. JC818]|uniref:hypothetical protein n=1 Tax=Thalassoglobus sp. JC818 TaxID=3232136 RepID=UPI003457E032